MLRAVEAGEVDLGFVPIENAIDGTVHLTQDALAFNHDLLIQREVVLDVEQCLMARPGTTLDDVKGWSRSRSPPPSATPSSRGCPVSSCGPPTPPPRRPGRWARQRAGAGGHRAERGAALRARGHRRDIADHDGNQTRFVLVAGRHPGADRPRQDTLVVYQRADEPGSLISILQEFAARRINLSRLESRPTKAGGLGDYCFVIDADGHVADELLADVLRDLHAKQGGVKFLGSYPAAGEHAGTAGSTPTPGGVRPTTGWPTSAAASDERAAGRGTHDRIRRACRRRRRRLVRRLGGGIGAAAGGSGGVVGAPGRRVALQPSHRPGPGPAYQVTTADEARALLDDPESIDVSAFADQIQQVAIIAIPVVRRLGALRHVPGVKKVPWVLSIITVANMTRSIRQGVREVQVVGSYLAARLQADDRSAARSGPGERADGAAVPVAVAPADRRPTCAGRPAAATLADLRVGGPHDEQGGGAGHRGRGTAGRAALLGG